MNKRRYGIAGAGLRTARCWIIAVLQRGVEDAAPYEQKRTLFDPEFHIGAVQAGKKVI